MPEGPIETIVVARRCLGYKHSKSEAHFLLNLDAVHEDDDDADIEKKD